MNRPEDVVKGEDAAEDASCPCSGEEGAASCCSRREGAAEVPAAAQEVMAALRQALEGRSFASEEEMQAFVQGFTAQWGRRPLDDFSGLSPEQMHWLLHFPFDSPELVAFPARLGLPPAAPLLTLVEVIVNTIGEQGLKATAKGNLPRKLVQEAAQVYQMAWGPQRYPLERALKEDDFVELHVARLVAELGGLIRRPRGTFLLRAEGRKALTEVGTASVYARLLLTYVRDFNWAYWDLYPSLPFLQHSFLYTLYLLSRYGDQWRASTFYEDAFLRAFPRVLEEVAPLPYSTPEEQVRNCYSWRVLDRFGGFLGLVEIRREAEWLSSRFQVRSTPLLKEAIRFGTASASVVVSEEDRQGPTAIH